MLGGTRIDTVLSQLTVSIKNAAATTCDTSGCDGDVCQSGGHGSRTRNPLRGTTSPMWPLTIRLPSKTQQFVTSTFLLYHLLYHSHHATHHQCSTPTSPTETPQYRTRETSCERYRAAHQIRKRATVFSSGHSTVASICHSFARSCVPERAARVNKRYVTPPTFISTISMSNQTPPATTGNERQRIGLCRITALRKLLIQEMTGSLLPECSSIERESSHEISPR